MPSAGGARDPVLQGEGLVREGVETLRAGWPADPITSETLPSASCCCCINAIRSDNSA